MKLDWRQIGRLAAVVVGQVVPGVQVIEQIAERFATLKGQEKQDAVVMLVQNALLAAEGVSGKDLATDADVLLATRRVIDTVVALHNIVARKTAAGV